MGPDARLVGVAIDCADAEPMVRFYTQVLGLRVTARDGDGWVQLGAEDGVHLNIQAEAGYEPPVWPEEPSRQQKMLHLEVLVDDLPVAVERALAAGGTEAAWQPLDRDPSRLRILLDPAGHPLCLFVRGE